MMSVQFQTTFNPAASLYGVPGKRAARLKNLPLSPTKGDLARFSGQQKSNPGVTAYRHEKDSQRSVLDQWCLKAIAWYQRSRRLDKNGQPKKPGALLYKLFGRSFGCPYDPSCSEYTADAIRKYGAVKGILKGAYRIFGKCNPITILLKHRVLTPEPRSIPDPVR